MLPFCGYNMGDYWNHWLSMETKVERLPRIFRVNWFRKGEDGQFLWPGFGENMRVLRWIVERVRGTAPTPIESPFGWMPHYKDLDWTGLDFDEAHFHEIMDIEREGALAEGRDQADFFCRFGHHLPQELAAERARLMQRLEDLPPVWRVA
jgi:phosphoenolpyruvate carboxykinase (GTP)